MSSEINNQAVAIEQLVAPVSVGTASGSPSLPTTVGAIVQDPTKPGKLYVGTGSGFSSSIDPSVIINGTNTGVGLNVIQSLTTGARNTAVGDQAMYSDTTGNDNVVEGYQALYNNTTGHRNIAIGTNAVSQNTTGGSNIGVGYQACYSCVTASNNVGIGDSALLICTAQNNTAIGDHAGSGITTGFNNICVGISAGSFLSTGSTNIIIGHPGSGGDSSTIRIGSQGTQTATYLAGVSGATSAAGVAVLVNSSGLLGTTTSSIRYKKDIEDINLIENAEILNNMKVVKFNYKTDKEGTPKQPGLIAEDVEVLDKNLVQYIDGKPETIFYQYIPIMLLAEVQRLNKKLADLEAKLN